MEAKDRTELTAETMDREVKLRALAYSLLALNDWNPAKISESEMTAAVQILNPEFTYSQCAMGVKLCY